MKKTAVTKSTHTFIPEDWDFIRLLMPAALNWRRGASGNKARCRDPSLKSKQGLAARTCLALFERDEAMRLLQAG